MPPAVVETGPDRGWVTKGVAVPDGAAVQGGANVAERRGEGGEVSVMDLPGADLFDDLDCAEPERGLG